MKWMVVFICLICISIGWHIGYLMMDWLDKKIRKR